MARNIKEFAHPDYNKWQELWKKIRDCYNGEDAIKANGVLYLPRLSAQNQVDYDNYLKRALFFPITGRTVSGMVGMATTKKPTVEAPDNLSKYFSDTENVGYQFTEFYVNIFNEIILQGRIGVLLDAPESGGQPVPSTYIAENIINWTEDVDGKLTMVLLREHVVVPNSEPFQSSVITQFRHCYLRNGVYYQEVLDDELKPTKAAFTPLFTGAVINHVPFTCIGATGVHMYVDKPPMLDIATINISHYLTSADLEWGRHIVGLPTPVVSGVDTSTKLTIGGTSAWVLPAVDAKAFYLEFQGQGLQSLEKAMTEKVGLMSAMSARLVDTTSKGSEAAEAVRLRYANESATLIHVIGAVENGLVIIYNSLAKLVREGVVKMSFSRDVLGANVTFNDMKVLFEAYLNGSLSKETLVYNLRRLDALDPNRTDEEELGAIKPPPSNKPADPTSKE